MSSAITRPETLVSAERGPMARLGVVCLTASLAWQARADDAIHQFGPSGGAAFDFSVASGAARYEFTTGDSLVAHLNAGGSIGGIAGSRNAVVIPEFLFFPEVRADTRTGLKLSLGVDAYAGIELSGGFDLGGGDISASYALGPRLTLPDQVRAGEFFSARGETLISGAGLDLNVGLPSFDLGMDVVLGGSASGAIEYGLFPFVPYNVGAFNLNLPDIRLPVFDLGLDFDLPSLPDFSFLDIPNLIPASQQDNALFRTKLPGIDPLRPGGPGPLLSAGEVVLVNPAASAQTSAPVIEDGAIVSRSAGDLMRFGLDLDGIATFAATGVSFTGLEIDIKPGSVSLAKLGYDLIDVKYGLEIGYELENRVDTFLEVDLSFVDALSGEAVDVLLREAGGVTFANSYSGRFDALPDIALLGSSDVEMLVDFTGLKRTLNQKGSLTLSDYMEIRALAARASVLGGIASIELGPLFYQKFELAGEFAALDVYDVSLTLSDLGLVDGLFDGRVLIDAIPTLDAYLGGTRPGARVFGTLDPAQFTLLETHQSAAGTPSADIVYAIGGGDATTRVRQELSAASYYVDASVTRQLSGLYVAPGSEFSAAGSPGTPTDATLRLNSIHNDGFVSVVVGPGSSNSLRFESVQADGALIVQGEGEMFFGDRGGIAAGTLVNGREHSITFMDNPFQADANQRVLLGRQKIENQGLLAARRRTQDVLLPVRTPWFDNTERGVVRAGAASTITFRAPSGSARDLFFSNQGLVEASGAGARIDIGAAAIGGGLVPGTADLTDATRGRFRARNGGHFDIRHVASRSSDFELLLSGALGFDIGAGSSTTFHSRIDLDGDLSLVNRAGGTLTLNGLQRLSESAQVDIVNDGLLDLASGITSLRAQGPSCPGCPPPAPIIRPIDLVNNGTVRVRAGAGFAFDVDIVDYAEGGASLNRGTWEVFGQRKLFDSRSAVDIRDQRSDLAIIDVRVSEVFGNAAKFADLAFDEVLDPDTGEVVSVTSDIGTLDTRLVFNDTTVRLHGAAHFGYFNTVAVNRGEFEIAHLQQFHTAGNYENRGGLTRVDEDGGLHVNGALIINGGEVRIGEHDSVAAGARFSELSTQGAELVQADGTLARRDVEINGGTLYLGKYARLGGLFTTKIGGAHVLTPGRSWVVRDVVTDDGFGNETVTPGEIVLETRGGVNSHGNPDGGVAEIHDNFAEVLIEGTAARFGGLDYLVHNEGSLTFAGGASFERRDSAVAAGNTLTNVVGGLLRLDGAQFRFAGADSLLVNEGTLEVGANAYFEVDRISAGADRLGRIDLAGVLNVAEGVATRRLVMTDGAIITPRIDLDGRPGDNGTLLAPTGTDGGAGGLLELAGGHIAGTALTARGGHGGRGSTAVLANGSSGGAGGDGGNIVLTGGRLVADAGIDLRGGAGGNGLNGVVVGFIAGAGGNGGAGGDGGDILLAGGELVLAGGDIDLRGGAGGARGLGATNVFGGRGANGSSGAAGAAGRLAVNGGTLTASAQAFDNAIRGEVGYSHGTLRFTDDLFELDASSTRLNALLGAADKSLAAGQALAFGQVLRIGAGSALTLAGGLLEAGTLELDAAASLAFLDGVLDVGSVHGDLLQQGGTLAPGNSPGLTTITGDYTLAGGVLELELAGLERGIGYDAVDVGGTATLGGTLMVNLIDGFQPAGGDVFELLAAEHIAGSFDALALALLPEGWNWQLGYLRDPLGTDFVTLRASAVPLPPAVWLLGSALLALCWRRRAV